MTRSVRAALFYGSELPPIFASSEWIRATTCCPARFTVVGILVLLTPRQTYHVGITVMRRLKLPFAYGVEPDNGFIDRPNQKRHTDKP